MKNNYKKVLSMRKILGLLLIFITFSVYSQSQKKLNEYLKYNKKFLKFLRSKDYEQAEKWGLKTYDVALTAFGEQHRKLAHVLSNIGEALRNQNKYDNAKDYYEKALQMSHRVHGPLHPDNAIILNNYGGLLREKKDFEDSEKKLMESLKVMEIAFGKNTKKSEGILKNLKLLYVEWQKPIKAQDIEEKIRQLK